MLVYARLIHTFCSPKTWHATCQQAAHIKPSFAAASQWLPPFLLPAGTAQKPGSSAGTSNIVQPNRSSPLLFGLLTDLLHFLPWRHDPLVSSGALLLLQYMCAEWSQVSMMQQHSLPCAANFENLNEVFCATGKLAQRPNPRYRQGAFLTRLLRVLI